MMYYKMMYESPLGSMILAASDTALVGAWFEGVRLRAGWMIILPAVCRLS